jgi:RNA 3'-terminal phosphate cyclase (ATP)
MVVIDGAYGEGGGQILRSSLTLSALTGKPLEIHHIRANRTQPGLRAQHLAAVQAVAAITRGSLEGAHMHSTRVEFIPGQPHSGTYTFKIPTAGALTLVLQTIFLPLSLAGGRSQISLSGGTHVRWSPSWHYLQECWLPLITMMGFRVALDLRKAGFYPRGGGEVKIDVLPVRSLRTYNCVDRGDLVQIRGLSGVANLEESIAKRQKHQALRRLYAVCADSKIKTVQLPSPGKGTFILLKATFSKGGCACYTALGEPGKRAERVADEAVDQLLCFLENNASLDEYMGDQVLLPLSIIPGKSAFRTKCLSPHLLTNAYVIQQFLPVEINIEGEPGAPALVEVDGVSLEREDAEMTLMN